MGCMPSKENQTRIAPPRAKVVPEDAATKEDKNTSVKAHILDAIKRGDLILFEKTMHTYQIKPTEVIGQQEYKKTVLHYIAESNFSDGMTLALEHIIQNNSNQAAKAINIQDATGNTPAIVCCIHDSVETLEILLRSGYVNLSVKNSSGKTAQGVANDNDSPCMNLLNTTVHSNATSRSYTPSGQLSQGSGSPKQSGSNKDKNDEIALPSAGKFSAQLKSIQSMQKEARLSTDTKLYQVLQDLTAHSSNFIDEEYPHDTDSVAPEEFQNEYTDKYGLVKWVRPNESDLKTLCLFEGIDLNIVEDSPLAGCDVYSALAAMTEYPQRLLKVFSTKEINKQGAYSVKFLVAGIPVEVLLDDYFPCTKDSHPLFSRPKTNELWFSLLEKALAKLYGSYHEISHIPITDALELMTGMPTSQHGLKEANIDELWNQMQEYDKKNYICCAGNTKVGEETNNRIFSVIRLYETEHYKIVKLRNHFKDFVWKGDFSDGSELWTKDIKEEVGHYTGEKSCFYMDMKEFVKQFDFISVCHYQESLIRNGEEVTSSPKKALFFEVELDREMEVFISVHQKLPRFVDEPDYDISPVEILVAEELDDGVLRKAARGEKDAFVGKHTVFADDKIRTKLSEGKYIVRVKVRWVDDQSHEFTLNTHSPYPLKLKQTKASKYPDFLERVYLEEGQRSNDCYQLGNRCEFGSSWCGSHLWLYGVNKGTKTWNLEIIFNKLENLTLNKKYRTENNIVKMVIPPKGQCVAFAKRVNSKSVELNWNFNQSWS